VPNEVQVMTAGTGVVHSEYNPDRAKAVNLLQTWIFPDTKNVPPRYDQAMFDPSGRFNQWQMLVSPTGTADAGLKIHQQAWIYRTTLQKGQSLEHLFHSARHGGYLFVIEGAATAEGQVLQKRDAVGISEGPGFTVTAQSDSELILFEVPML